jgi:hypothetical protein
MKGGIAMKWYWEPRSNNEYNPPQIATFLEGWDVAKGDLESTIDPAAEVFVREIIQNFVDASRDFRGKAEIVAKPKLTFRFLEYFGEQAIDLANRLGLAEVRNHFDSIANKSDMRLPDSLLLQPGKNPPSIRLLVVTESGTSGMYGHWDRSQQFHDANGQEIQHKMRDALLATVRGSAGSGLGSFGEGKKAVIGISRIRTLFAYTCFDKSTSENSVSRRFMGGTYWQNHTSNNTNFSGFAMVGGAPSAGESRPRPFEDKEADGCVAKLNLPGLDRRNGADAGDFGTTLVFLDPNTNADDVAESIGRNWWPLIEAGTHSFEIFNEAGDYLEPKISEPLKPFIEIFRSAESNSVIDWANANGEVAVKIQDLVSEKIGGKSVGILKLGIDLQPAVGWSRANPESNWSIVALVRDGMLIAYQQFPLASRMPAPFVRGVFVVDSQVNSDAATLLRRTEPPLHNKWKRAGQEIETKARALASQVYSEIRKNVDEFRQEHIATSARLENELSIFRDNFALSGSRRIVDPPDPDPAQKNSWSMLAEKAYVQDNGDGRRVAHASRTIQLAAGVGDDEEVLIQLGWEVLEDASWKEPEDSLLYGPIEVPAGFRVSDKGFNFFVGKVTRVERKFSWRTKPYGEPWTLRPYMRVTALSKVVGGSK